MDLNHIDLPPSVVTELYHSTLIETRETPAKVQPVMATVEGPKWESLGDNHQHILVIVQYADAKHLPDREFSFLTGILAACKLTVGDVALVNLANYPGASYKELISFFRSRIIFLFDVEPATFGLPISFPHFQLQSFANNSFLFSPSLQELEEDKVLKSKLWVCLRRIFGL